MSFAITQTQPNNALHFRPNDWLTILVNHLAIDIHRGIISQCRQVSHGTV